MFKKIDINEFSVLLNGFIGKKTEIAIYSPTSIQTSNTYEKFSFTNEDSEDYFILFENDSEKQKIHIQKDNIQDIQYIQETDIYSSVFDINLINGLQISLTLSESPIKCCICGKYINQNNCDTVWGIKGRGNYGSHWDGIELNINFCDNCLYTILNKDGVQQ